MTLTRIAVTGGPCAGKTTVMEAVRNQYGSRVLVMPEVASILLGNGFPRAGTEIKMCERYADSLQASILPVQINMEKEYLEMGHASIANLVLFDRGVMDGASYLGKTVPYFLERFGLTQDEVFGRYDAIIHMESVAVSDPVLYEQLKATNPARYESAAEAIARDASIKEVWDGHPNRIVFSSSWGMKKLTSAVFSFMDRFLGLEIEAKFLLSGLPDIDLNAGVRVRQGYLPTPNEIRVRQMGDEYYVTFKSKGTGTRQECDPQITQFAFEDTYLNTVGQIEKMRYYIPYQGLTLELDVFYGSLEGLVTLECEFKSTAEMSAFVLPDWASEALDVTHDKRYKNKTLALKGLPVR